jgi:hypothetical protein
VRNPLDPPPRSAYTHTHSTPSALCVLRYDTIVEIVPRTVCHGGITSSKEPLLAALLGTATARGNILAPRSHASVPALFSQQNPPPSHHPALAFTPDQDTDSAPDPAPDQASTSATTSACAQPPSPGHPLTPHPRSPSQEIFAPLLILLQTTVAASVPPHPFRYPPAPTP